MSAAHSEKTKQTTIDAGCDRIDEAPLTQQHSAEVNTITTAMMAAYTSAMLAACGGGTDAHVSSETTPSLSEAYIPSSNQEAARFLQQAQFSSTTSDIQALRKSNFVKWLNSQYTNSNLDQTTWDWIMSKEYTLVEDLTSSGGAYQMVEESPFIFSLWKYLITCKQQMKGRMALALSEFFVINSSEVNYDWHSLASAAYWDILVKNAFGNFRTLLKEVTLSVAMGKFLNTCGNTKGDDFLESNKGTKPDENYAREIMQLYTIGLHELNLDGSLKNNKLTETYTQSDVMNLARVFTGYTEDSTFRPAYMAYKEPMVITDMEKHSRLDVLLFEGKSNQTSISGATDPAEKLDKVLDILFMHPNVGPFFAKCMIQRLVTSNPSPAYIARVASAFNDNGQGIRGDLKAVWSAILLDYEARAMPTSADTTFGKLREPMLRFLQWARTCGLTSVNGNWKILIRGDMDPKHYLGQAPFKAPSVFNFFRPEYIPPGTKFAAKKLFAPEFQITTEGKALQYVNYMARCIYIGLFCWNPSTPYLYYTEEDDGKDLHATYTTEYSLVTNPTSLIDYLILVFSAGQISSTSRTTMISALKNLNITAASPPQDKLKGIASAVLMVITCPEYIVQK